MIRDISRNLRVRSIMSHGQKLDPVTGDEVTYVDTHEIHITTDEIILQDDGGTPYRAAAVDVLADINNSGANGLDTGTKASHTWYNVWVIADSTDSVSGLLSTSASEPTLPAGYIYKAYIGAVYYTEDHFASYFQNDSLVWAQKTVPFAMDAFPTTPTAIDLSASVPTTAISVILELSGLTTIGGHSISNISVGPTADGPWHNRWMMVSGTPQGGGTIDHVQFITQSEILLDSVQEIYAKVGTNDDRLEIHVLGWRY